ncbi:UPF0739 protein C1orf74 homolog [Acanthaster planci]|uniref:UPF0739 protein C1orf74 homolog n=1 Tax=Acanthaster planci TaxID=133434 RepID=A0A8B7Z639_ACAPL|nr:UPF0739 protein C1orf74 homolog [Acanthaster planci]XP_022100260.1 UPF0739 protein C1orf74 homolog [Acanthaster planci]XP_022100268.1 UPF0739 protein C1orf74 homolog [Acanthaster planci]
METAFIMKRYVGRTARKNWREILCDMEAVSSGIKPSFLYDYSCIEPTELSKMVDDLIVSGLLVKENLQVLSLGQDSFLANKPLLQETLGEFLGALEGGNHMLVDVSAKLEQPQLLDDEGVERIKDHVRDVMMQLQDLSRTPVTVLELNPKPGWNFSTLFGVLLGYPVVYWFHDVQRCSNCLSMVPLSVYRVSANHDDLQHSANPPYPIDTTSHTPQLSEVVNEHPIYSFSVPEALLPHFQDHIDDWFKRVQAKAHKELRLTCKSVTLPSITL